MKTLLIRSGTAEAAEVANRAKQMGCYIVMADRGLEVPAFAYSDSCLLADATNPDEMLPAAERFSRKRRKIDGVITISDAALPAAAAVAERLGLLPETVKLLADKLATKQRLLEAGLSVSWFAPVATPQALQRILIERGTDLLIWPADNRSVAMN